MFIWRKYGCRRYAERENDMFGVLAKTYFRATGIPPRRYHRDTDQSWYGEDMGAKTAPKRWEDFK